MNREAYDKYASLIDERELKESSRELSFLYNTVKQVHEDVPAHNISCDELDAAFWQKYPEASKELYTVLLKDIRDLDISDAVGESLLAGIARKKALLSLSTASFELSQGRGSPEEIKRLYEAVEAPPALEEEFDHVTTDLETLVNNVVRSPGLRWRLNALNRSLGSLRRGDFGFVFARPESGKTTFLASEVSAMIDLATSPVVWFNNEEEGQKVMLRFYQAYFGVELETLLTNVSQYQKLFKDKVGDKFILVDDAGIDCRRIERIIDRVKPSLIIYDQIDKIKGFKADRDDLVYGAIYQWARELAKTYAPSIGVCQADGSAEGQKWLTMANVANAKTSKQAEADFIIGLGKTHQEEAEYIRYINLSKNKLVGDEDSIPSLRHGRLEVLIQPEIARYRDIIDFD
jgi:KaiC/GvpD/RAD55 family RecA-like ATPase